MSPLSHFFCFLLLCFFLPTPSSSSSRTPHKKISVTRFLHRFGYLQNPDDTTNLKSALSLYQSNHGLTITGHLDSTTLAQISTPRCGVTDDKITGAVVARYAFFPGQPRWSTKPPPITLTYALSPNNTIHYLTQSQIISAIQRAFDHWAKVIPVTFVQAKNYEKADVKLGFYTGDHGDGEAFDGVLGVLGHAFSPESGRLHLDKAERWAVDFDEESEDVAVDLESVVTHEIGPVLGLGHSTAREAVMFPSLRPRTKKAELSVDDVEGVQSLYGSNPNFEMSSVLESDTSDCEELVVMREGLGLGLGLVMVIVTIMTLVIGIG